MDCSRCGGELETYSLGDEEAYVCGDCGFVDTPVEHEATHRPKPEPWETALKRFHEKYVEGDVAITGSGETAALVEIERDQPADEPASDDEPAGDDEAAEPSDEAEDDAADASDEQEAGEDTAVSDTADEPVDDAETDESEDTEQDDDAEVESEDRDAEPAEGETPTDEPEKPA